MGQVNPLQDVVDKRVYDAHMALHVEEMPCVGVDLFAKVWDRTLLLPPPLLALFLATLGDGFLDLCEGLVDVCSWHRTLLPPPLLLALLLVTLGDGFLDLCEGLVDVHR